MIDDSHLRSNAMLDRAQMVGAAHPGDGAGAGDAGTKREGGVVVEERTRTKKPPMYKVLLHNDDYTTKEFVVMVLQHVFHRSEADANRIMLHVHNNGVGVAGIYPYEIAETKVAKTMQLAKRYEYPLQLSLEPDQ
jgi:ATP-dependent Clp protease adaptor protein ClpS